MNLSKLLVAGSLTALASIASAESFTFSYEIFEGGTAPLHKVTGTFNGTRGLGVDYLVTGLSNVSVFVDGEGFHNNGHLNLGHYNPNNTNQILDDDAVVSKFGDLNNFVFSDSGMANNTGWTNTFFSNGITPNGQTGYLFRYATKDHPDVYSHEKTLTAHWSLNQVAAAVPEPETYAMLLAGLGLVGAVARRRKNNHG